MQARQDKSLVAKDLIIVVEIKDQIVMNKPEDILYQSLSKITHPILLEPYKTCVGHKPPQSQHDKPTPQEAGVDHLEVPNIGEV